MLLGFVLFKPLCDRFKRKKTERQERRAAEKRIEADLLRAIHADRVLLDPCVAQEYPELLIPFERATVHQLDTLEIVRKTPFSYNQRVKMDGEDLVMASTSMPHGGFQGEHRIKADGTVIESSGGIVVMGDRGFPYP